MTDGLSQCVQDVQTFQFWPGAARTSEPSGPVPVRPGRSNLPHVRARRRALLPSTWWPHLRHFREEEVFTASQYPYPLQRHIPPLTDTLPGSVPAPLSTRARHWPHACPSYTSTGRSTARLVAAIHRPALAAVFGLQDIFESITVVIAALSVESDHPVKSLRRQIVAPRGVELLQYRENVQTHYALQRDA